MGRTRSRTETLTEFSAGRSPRAASQKTFEANGASGPAPFPPCSAAAPAQCGRRAGVRPRGLGGGVGEGAAVSPRAPLRPGAAGSGLSGETLSVSGFEALSLALSSRGRLSDVASVNPPFSMTQE